MNWNTLTCEQDLAVIRQESFTQPVLIFKHSTRCSISAMALTRFERDWQPEYATLFKPYYLDLIAHRDLSAKIATGYNIRHESPQVLLISKGDCIYHASHYDIRIADLLKITTGLQ